MAERYHLDVVKREDETIWFTLVIEEPVRYFVEQYHESRKAFESCRTRQIPAEELARHWVNDRPLIKLVENKLQELIEAARKDIPSLRLQPATSLAS